MTDQPHSDKWPPRIRGNVWWEEPPLDINFCWEQWSHAPFKYDLDDHEVEYVSLEEMRAAVTEERAKAFEEAAATFNAEAKRIGESNGRTFGELAAYTSQRGAALWCETKAAEARSVGAGVEEKDG